MINIADRLTSPKIPFVTHHALYVGLTNGVHSVIENQIGFGVRLISLTDFKKEHPNYKVVPFKGTESERLQAAKRAKAGLGKSYNLFLHNCETFVNNAQYKKPESKQVRNTLVGLGLLVLVKLISR